MGTKTAILLLLCAFFGAAVAKALGAETDFSKAAWEQISNEDGIQVLRWDVPDSDVFAFKAIGTVDASVGKVASVLIDLSREKEWLPDLKENKLIRQISHEERVVYTHVGTPPLVKDRDFVLQEKAEFDEKTKHLVMSFWSVEDPTVAPTHYVRGELHASSYTIWPTEDGKRTNMIFLVHVDPRGSIAKWIVNFFQKSYPREAMEAIRKQAKKADIVENAEVKAKFEQVSKVAAR